jgi:NitT/TauT family transport system substrate-binding protein
MIFMGFYVAQAEGFFARNGLQVTLQGQPTGNQAVRGLAAGAGTFAAGGTDANVAADAAGEDLVAIWSYGADDLSVIAADSVSSLAGLKGKVIGITDKAGPAYSLPVLALNSVGLQADAAQYVILGGRPALVTALASGRIQASAFHVDDGLALVQKDPHVRVLAQMNKVAPQWWYGAVSVKKSYAQSHPKVVTDFLTAMIEAQKWMYSHPAQTIALAVKDTQEDPSVVTKAYNQMAKDHDWSTDAGFTMSQVSYTINQYKHDGVIPSSSSLSAASIVDLSYINTVLSKLGS